MYLIIWILFPLFKNSIGFVNGIVNYTCVSNPTNYRSSLGSHDKPIGDINGNGQPDYLDVDDDGDGIPDAISMDDDGDGIPDELDDHEGGIVTKIGKYAKFCTFA